MGLITERRECVCFPGLYFLIQKNGLLEAYTSECESMHIKVEYDSSHDSMAL
jgi:hypothetical protein